MASSSNQVINEFIFGEDAGEFKGDKVRVLEGNPRKVSLYDIMSIMGDTNPSKTFLKLKEKYPEVIIFGNNFKFSGQGQRDTPVVNAKELINILMILPGERAAAFRIRAANIIVRYLSGDLSLIPEIEKNNVLQNKEPDHFGFKDLVMDNLDKGTLPPYDFLIPPITDNLLPPNVVYIFWVGYCHKNNVHVFKYGETLDIRNRSNGHKIEQKSINYILQISCGTHATNSLEKTIEKFTIKLRSKLNIGKDSLNREIFVCRNLSDLQEIVGKIVKVCNSDYFKAYIKDIRIADGIIDKIMLLKYDIQRLKYQYEIDIAKKQLLIKELENNKSFLNEIDINTLDIDDEIPKIDYDDIVSDIVESENDEENQFPKYDLSILSSYPYDTIEYVDNLDEFISKYCIIGPNERVFKFTLYNAYTTYVKPEGFLGQLTFYKEIKKYKDINVSETLCGSPYIGISLKPGVVPDIYIYIRDFIGLKCDIGPQFRCKASELFEAFDKYIKEEIKLNDSYCRIHQISKHIFYETIKKNYPFKFKYISQHEVGFEEIKIKNTITYELSELVKNFIEECIEKTNTSNLSKRPVYRKFIDWYTRKYEKNDTVRNWGRIQFAIEFQKYFEFKNDRWQNMKFK